MSIADATDDVIVIDVILVKLAPDTNPEIMHEAGKDEPKFSLPEERLLTVTALLWTTPIAVVHRILDVLAIEIQHTSLSASVLKFVAELTI